jgi:hypothetical protein
MLLEKRYDRGESSVGLYSVLIPGGGGYDPSG